MLYLERGPDGAAGVVENDEWPGRRVVIHTRAVTKASQLRSFQSLLAALADSLASFPSCYLKEMRMHASGQLVLVQEIHT